MLEHQIGQRVKLDPKGEDRTLLADYIGKTGTVIDRTGKNHTITLDKAFQHPLLGLVETVQFWGSHLKRTR